MVKRSIKQWRELFKQHDESGLTAAQFCRNNGLCPRYFSKRKKDLAWPATVKVKSKLVKLIPPKPNTALPTLTLQLGNVKLNVNGELSPQWLAQVMKAVAQ
jgi:hypothetical protein